jgi:hypothetical protein
MGVWWKRGVYNLIEIEGVGRERVCFFLFFQ